MTTYIRARDGATVTEAEALDGRGTLRSGYSLSRRLSMTDSTTRTPVTDASIQDAAATVFDAAPMHFGSLARIIAQAKSPDPTVALDAAREARDQAHRLTMFADGLIGPRALSDAQRAACRRVAEYLNGYATGTAVRFAA